MVEYFKTILPRKAHNKNIQIHEQAEINDYLLFRNYYFIFELNGEI